MTLSDRIFQVLQERGPMTDDELMAALPNTKRPSLRRSRQVLVKRGLIYAESAVGRGHRWAIVVPVTQVTPPVVQLRVVN